MKHSAIHKGEYQEGGRRSRKKFGSPFFVGYITLIFNKFFFIWEETLQAHGQVPGGVPTPTPTPTLTPTLAPTLRNILDGIAE